MRISIRRVAALTLVLSRAALFSAADPTVEDAKRVAELDRLRLIGATQYENSLFVEAAETLERCTQLSPGSAEDQFNLALTLIRASRYPDAMKHLDEAHRLDPRLSAVDYIRGILHKRTNEFAAAVRCLRRVIDRDPGCFGAYYNLGICYKYLDDNENARIAFEEAVRIDPDHPSAHYQLITIARNVGDVEKAKRHAEIYDRIKDTIPDSEKTLEALERSRYSYLIHVGRRGPDLSPDLKSQVRFHDVTQRAGLSSRPEPKRQVRAPIQYRRDEYDASEAVKVYAEIAGGAVALGDVEGDGDLDLYVVNCGPDGAAQNRMFLNEGDGRFRDATQETGTGDALSGTDAIFGDYDNDGLLDLYVVNAGPNVLYRNLGNGKFENVSESSQADEPQFGRQAAFVDYDHDNDLDLCVVNELDFAAPAGSVEFLIPDDLSGQFNTLLRNNGNGTFTDQTDQAGLLEDVSKTRAVVVADFEGDADIDLFTANLDLPSLLFTNARMGRMELGGTFAPSLDAGTRVAVAGEFTRDTRMDLLVAVSSRLLLYVNEGEARFKGHAIDLPSCLGDKGVERIALLDFNNDGWTDVLLVGAGGQGLCLLAGTGAAQFRDVTAGAGLDSQEGEIAGVAVGDVDADGDEDIVLLTRDRGVRLLSNTGTEASNWLVVSPRGRKVARTPRGATVEIAVKGHYQKQVVQSQYVHFGLGHLDRLDIARITWPSGVAQNVINPPINSVLAVEEHVTVSASCAFLWSWNGERFELVNEVLGIGALGVPMSPGQYHQPDHTELTKIAAGQLSPHNGVYKLRLTEELREIMFADQIELRLVDHPAEYEVIPNEMFTAPPFPEDKFYAVKHVRRPVSAVDHRGADVLKLIRDHDGRFPVFERNMTYDELAEAM